VLGTKDISEIGAARAAALTPFGAPRSLALQAGEGEAPPADLCVELKLQ
jgi:hypothetical protein